MFSGNEREIVDCTTPEHQNDSPSRDSDGLYDSDSASPINFLCSQDVDVIWNDYTPKSGKFSASRIKNSTPISSKNRKSSKSKVIEQPLPKRQSLRLHRKPHFLQELLEINRNSLSLTNNDTKKDTIGNVDKRKDEDIFNEFSHLPSKEGLNLNLCSKKTCHLDKLNDIGFDFDDSTNEDLLKASQKVEEKLLSYKFTPAKKSRNEFLHAENLKFVKDMEQSSMNVICNVQTESSIHKSISNIKIPESPCFNDTFDSFDVCLNDSALDNLIQKPLKNVTSKDNNRYSSYESPSTCGFFSRHNSMPESPTTEPIKPSMNSIGFNRYKSLPHDNNKSGLKADPNSSPPMCCTPEEIKKKHQLAREKLLAKRLLPFTVSTQQQLPENQTQPVQPSILSKKPAFQPKFPSNKNLMPRVTSMPINGIKNSNTKSKNNKTVQNSQTNSVDTDLKSIIEKKRQEALMKLRRKQQQRVATS
ncbi:hypothetical protein EVAR_4172_1 [Eumeta japonica]|uniref:Uncharacterized protein n=1 Tax=Eumeta variegata TaxID=151549 RepID=A0A4C1TFZ0_EUMVA|nr:hypothetical protein EVAR_4172_1 [Eumeta japonica]